MTSWKVWEGKEGRKVLSVDWSGHGGIVGVGGEGGLEVWRVGEDQREGK
jgi:ribosome biogenesis protein YTM1